jgi:hypothetical protein
MRALFLIRAAVFLSSAIVLMACPSSKGPPLTAEQLSELLRRPVPNVVTQRMNNARTGVNGKEYVLNPESVTSGQFHKVFAFPVDGQIYGQPLFLPGVKLADGTVHNLVIVTTAMNSVFVFDAAAASGAGTVPLGRLSLGTPVPANYMPMAYTSGSLCPWDPPAKAVTPAVDGHPYNLAPTIGIVSTPVIDPSTSTLFLTTKSIDSVEAIIYRLHALTLAPQLSDRAGSPKIIAASVPSLTGAAAQGGLLAFDARMHLQRPALLLQQGHLFIAFGSQQDTAPYHGWLFEYDAANLNLVRATALNAESDGAGIWQAGSGPIGMPDGSVVVMTGNSGWRGCIFQGSIIDPPNQENSFLRFTSNSSAATGFRHPDSPTLNL